MGTDRLRKVGAMWKPKPGQKSLGSGMITINGVRQRFVVLLNDRKQTETHPDYVLMSSEEPTIDTYQAPAAASRRDDDIAF